MHWQINYHSFFVMNIPRLGWRLHVKFKPRNVASKTQRFFFSLGWKIVVCPCWLRCLFHHSCKMQISWCINGRITATLLTLETYLKTTNRGDWTVILIFHSLFTSWDIVENKHFSGNLKDTPSSHILQLLNVCKCEFCHEKRFPLFKLLKIWSYPDCCPPWRSAPSWVASCILSWRAICRVGSQLTKISLTAIEYGFVIKETF